MIPNFTPPAYTETELYPGELISFQQEANVFHIKAENEVLLTITVMSDDIVRFRYATRGYYEPDFSYAIAPNHPFDGAEVVCMERRKSIAIQTKSITVVVNRKDLRITILDEDGEVLCQDEKGFHWERNETYGGDIVQMSKVAFSDEAYYGLGDKPTRLNLRGKGFEHWGTDTYGFHETSDPIYRNIPFYYSYREDEAYGIFFDNSFKTQFDFARERRTVTSFWAQGGEMNYYFINGPKLLDICQRYTLLTGTPDMPPLWALGYQQCKWSYYPEAQVRDVCAKMRQHKVPCDAIYLDIDYMDGYRCFTWDKEKFPDPKKMVKELEGDGFKTVVIIDPGIKIDMEYRVFREGMEKGYFCKRQDGPYVVGKVWPGECYFPDFTRPEVREWWAGLYEGLIGDIGVSGVWNDMNEPAIFEVESKTFPPDVRHDYDGHPCSHRKAHNVYGMQMARATYEGVKRFSHPKRPLIITRSGYSGLQRFSSVWTGDNIASWQHLWIANAQCQRLAVSGISFAGSDVGGFIGQPSPELFYRWVQLSVFHPFFRTHSSGDHGDQEPWSFGEEALDMARIAIELRYRLLPLIYTAFHHYHTSGMPMLKPLAFVDQEGNDVANRMDEFVLGEHLLVCPILEPESKGRNLYLPQGNWYNYYKNNLQSGRHEFFTEVDKTFIPVFVREGAVLPHFPVQQYVGEKRIETVELRIYHKAGRETSTFYHDAGDGQGYLEGDYRLATFTLTGNGGQLSVTQYIKGHHEATFGKYLIKVVGMPFVPECINVDGVDYDWDEDGVEIPAGFGELVARH